jgi:hypothetical protein
LWIAHPEDGRDRFGRPLEGVIEHPLWHSSRLLPNFQKIVEQHELWSAGEAERQAVADHQGGKPRKKTGKKRIEPQAAVIVDLSWLMKELKDLNAKRKPQDQLELTASGLTDKSPPGAPRQQTWEKLLKGKPVRSDVPAHLIPFFKLYGRSLKTTDIPVKHV